MKAYFGYVGQVFIRGWKETWTEHRSRVWWALSSLLAFAIIGYLRPDFMGIANGVGPRILQGLTLLVASVIPYLLINMVRAPYLIHREARGRIATLERELRSVKQSAEMTVKDSDVAGALGILGDFQNHFFRCYLVVHDQMPFDAGKLEDVLNPEHGPSKLKSRKEWLESLPEDGPGPIGAQVETRLYQAGLVKYVDFAERGVVRNQGGFGTRMQWTPLARRVASELGSSEVFKKLLALEKVKVSVAGIANMAVLFKYCHSGIVKSVFSKHNILGIIASSLPKDYIRPNKGELAELGEKAELTFRNLMLVRVETRETKEFPATRFEGTVLKYELIWTDLAHRVAELMEATASAAVEKDS